MQTFLPYPDFARSAAVLDRLRLGKQRVEAWQILLTLTGETSGWKSHPVMRMWEGYEDALRAYGRAVCSEWIARGYRDNMLERFRGPEAYAPPPWLGDERFHVSHRSNLYRKDPEHYASFAPVEQLPYVWPIAESPTP